MTFEAISFADLATMDFTEENAARRLSFSLARQLVPRCQSPIEKKFLSGWIDYIEESGIRSELLEKCLAVQVQYVIEEWRVDLALPLLSIAVELDGHQFHSSKEHRTRDAFRQRCLTSRGWKVVRFTGTEITKDCEDCCEHLHEIIRNDSRYWEAVQ